MTLVPPPMIPEKRRGEEYGAWLGAPVGSGVSNLYPNLAEELIFPGFLSNLCTVLSVSGVRRSAIAFALESGTTLTDRQLERLSAALHVSVEYLADPCLAVVNPNTAAGANQTYWLIALMKTTRGLLVQYSEIIDILYKTLNDGYFAPYSVYRNCIRLLLNAKRHPLLNRTSTEPYKAVYTLHIGEVVEA